MPRRMKPTNMKLVQGTYRKDRENPNHPMPELAVPDMPEGLSSCAAAEWDRVVEQLRKLGVISESDWAIVRNYCHVYEMAEQAREMIESEGLLLECKKHPAVMIREKALGEMRYHLSEMGLTPSARTKVGVSPDAASNPIADLKKKYGKK